MLKRCNWAGTDELYLNYHDREWGVPLHDDCRLFEMLILEGAQAGLSWSTVLKKRENYRKALVQFDPQKVARFKQRQVEKLIANPGIIRNRLKIESTVKNARIFLEVQQEFGSFNQYIWKFSGGKPIINTWHNLKELPAQTRESGAMSKDLRKRGFTFVGPTICYAFMQAIGMVNDHLVDCFRYREINKGQRDKETKAQSNKERH
jgi:DNA-3-methyladenine glycosylase I